MVLLLITRIRGKSGAPRLIQSLSTGQRGYTGKDEYINLLNISRNNILMKMMSVKPDIENRKSH